MFSDIRAFRTRRLFPVKVCRNNYSQGLWNSQVKGWPKNRETRFFLWLSRVCFFHFVSSWSPVVFTYLVVCKCVIHPCFLTFIVMFSFFAVVVFSCFYSSLCLQSAVLFTFHSVVCLCCLLSWWCEKNQIK